MSDREEFEKWYDETTNCNHGVAYYVDITGRYCHHDIEIAWQAWQAARTQSVQGAEPVGFVQGGGLEQLSRGHPAKIYPKNVTPSPLEPHTFVYPHPQPAVPECPYPCGWDNLFKMIVENAANFARSTLDDEVPESVRQMGIDSGQYAIHLCKLVMKLSAPTGLKRPQPPKEGKGDE